MFELIIRFWCCDTVRFITDAPAVEIALFVPRTIRSIECTVLAD